MICAIVLAAGRSRRMGTAKLLLPFGGQTLIERVIAALASPHVERIFVVIREGDAEVPSALEGTCVEFVSNQDSDGDMLSSVRCGFRALPTHCEAALVVLGDQPGITRELVEALVSAYRKTGSSLVVPRGPSGRGHPLLVGLEHRDEILAACDDVGLRGLLQAHAVAVHELRVHDDTALSDVDTPEDYARLSARFMNKVNTNHLPETSWSSPKGKFAGFGREVSEALGRKPQSTDLNERHPFDVEILRIPPGKTPYPYHSHSAQWEFYHVISGKGTARHESGTTPVEAGDAFLFRPGEPHQLINDSEEDLVVYVVADNPIGESCYYPDSKKWLVRSPERRLIRSLPLDYYDGEESR